MNKAFLSLGSNIGDRENFIRTAILKLKDYGISIINESKIYESEPWGEKNQNWFLNSCIEIETDLSPKDLYSKILEIENDLGKTKITKYGPRKIDIDILFYNDFTLNEQHLIIPHPRLTDRQFVLTPLSEIAPNLVHPIDNKTILELKSKCSDKSKIRLWIQDNSENLQPNSK